MQPISYKRHRFPTLVIQHAVWLYFRFSLSLRDIEDLLAERGIEVSYETIRCWTRKFGQQFAGNLRRSRPKPTATWHLDEMVVRINGQQMYVWRAVDSEGLPVAHRPSVVSLYKTEPPLGIRTPRGRKWRGPPCAA